MFWTSLISTRTSISLREWRRSSSLINQRSRTSLQPRGRLCPRFASFCSLMWLNLLSKCTYTSTLFSITHSIQSSIDHLLQDIFDDFTEHWVASSPHRAKSVDSLDSASEQGSGSGSRTPRTLRTPNTRNEHRDGQRGTRIPAPTFYRAQNNAKKH